MRHRIIKFAGRLEKKDNEEKKVINNPKTTLDTVENNGLYSLSAIGVTETPLEESKYTFSKHCDRPGENRSQ